MFALSTYMRSKRCFLSLYFDSQPKCLPQQSPAFIKIFLRKKKYAFSLALKMSIYSCLRTPGLKTDVLDFKCTCGVSKWSGLRTAHVLF